MQITRSSFFMRTPFIHTILFFFLFVYFVQLTAQAAISLSTIFHFQFSLIGSVNYLKLQCIQSCHCHNWNFSFLIKKKKKIWRFNRFRLCRIWTQIERLFIFRMKYRTLNWGKKIFFSCPSFINKILKLTEYSKCIDNQHYPALSMKSFIHHSFIFFSWPMDNFSTLR